MSHNSFGHEDGFGFFGITSKSREERRNEDEKDGGQGLFPFKSSLFYLRGECSPETSTYFSLAKMLSNGHSQLEKRVGYQVFLIGYTSHLTYNQGNVLKKGNGYQGRQLAMSATWSYLILLFKIAVYLRSGTVSLNLEFNNSDNGYIIVNVNSVGGKAILLTFALNWLIHLVRTISPHWHKLFWILNIVTNGLDCPMYKLLITNQLISVRIWLLKHLSYFYYAITTAYEIIFYVLSREFKLHSPLLMYYLYFTHLLLIFFQNKANMNKIIQ